MTECAIRVANRDPFTVWRMCACARKATRISNARSRGQNDPCRVNKPLVVPGISRVAKFQPAESRAAPDHFARFHSLLIHCLATS